MREIESCCQHTLKLRWYGQLKYFMLFTGPLLEKLDNLLLLSGYSTSEQYATDNCLEQSSAGAGSDADVCP